MCVTILKRKRYSPKGPDPLSLNVSYYVICPHHHSALVQTFSSGIVLYSWINVSKWNLYSYHLLQTCSTAQDKHLNTFSQIDNWPNQHFEDQRCTLEFTELSPFFLSDWGWNGKICNPCFKLNGIMTAQNKTSKLL